MILLGVLILFISYIQSYFPPERTKRILGGFHGVGANAVAALLGTVTPFCSCSSIPLFIGFTSAGLPLGVTFSFLISSPMVDLGSLVLLMSVFGWKVAVVYVFVGLVIAVAGGTLIEKLHMEDQVEGFRRKNPYSSCAGIRMILLPCFVGEYERGGEGLGTSSRSRVCDRLVPDRGIRRDAATGFGGQ